MYLSQKMSSSSSSSDSNLSMDSKVGPISLMGKSNVTEKDGLCGKPCYDKNCVCCNNWKVIFNQESKATSNKADNKTNAQGTDVGAYFNPLANPQKIKSRFTKILRAKIQLF